jgi:uncharacterized protein YbjT (DUF2867 family)
VERFERIVKPEVVMILVVGAAGLPESEICRSLRLVGQPARALVRPGSSREKVEAMQTTVVEYRAAWRAA